MSILKNLSPTLLSEKHYRKTQSMARTKKKLCGTLGLWTLFPVETFSGFRHNPFYFFPTILWLCNPYLPPVAICKEDSYRYLFIPFHTHMITLFSVVHRGMIHWAWRKTRLGCSDLQSFWQRSILPHDWSTLGLMYKVGYFVFHF